MKRFEKILAFVLSLVLLLVQMPMVIGAEETRTQTKNREYYVVPQGTGDGRTHANAAGSIPAVVATINSDGHKAGDNVTVYIDSRNGSGVVPTRVTSAADVIAYHSTSTPIHTATITYKPYSNYEALLGYVEYGKTYNQMFLSGPTVFENLTMIDLSTNDYWYGMIYNRGYSVTYRNIKWRGISASTGEITNQDSNAREYYTGNATNGTALSCSNEQRVVWDGAGNTIYRLVLGSRITSAAHNKDMHTVNGNLTLELANTANKANSVFLSHVEPSTNLYMTYKGNVNIVMKNGCYAYLFYSNGAEDGNGYLNPTNNKSLYPVVEGAIQVVANAGSKWNHDTYDFTAYTSSARTSLTPVYKIKNNDNSVVIDVTNNAGEYTVSGDKTVYVARGDKIYYGNKNVNLKVPSAEEYVLTSANSVEDIKADNIPTSSSKVFIGWEDDGNGTLTAKFKVGEKKRYMLKVVNDGELCAPLCQNVTLEKGKTYTVSYKYKFVTGYMDTSLYFFVGNAQNYKGGDGKVYYMSCYNDTRVFDSVKYDDNIAQVEYTFTLTDRYKTDGAAYYTIPDGKSLCSTGFVFENAHKGLTTELYIAEMVLYETGDMNKKNLLPVTDYSNGMDGWGCQWKGADAYSSSFTHSSCDYVAAYEPLDEAMFKYSAFGDANQDKNISIADLVRTKKLISNDKYIITADVGKDGVLNAMDLTSLRKHLLGIEEIETLVYPNKVETGYSDAEALALKNTIESTSDSVSSKLLRTYYVDSVSGNDSNLGIFENYPLKTLDALSKKTLKSGDVVLFKRGSVFRSDKRIKLVSGVSYGAYGSGEKPIFMGSLKDYAQSDWEDMGNGIWKLSETVSGQAGVVTFDSNTTIGYRKESISQLLKNGDYYHDYKDTGNFYLKLGGKNPADYFNNIEICSADYAFFGIYADSNGKYQRENITVNNISFMYYGSNCIDLAYCSNIKITGCEFRYIGGNNFSSTTRAGNAITIWNTCDGVTVNNCLFYEIFDAPFTFQGDDSHATYEEISVTNCLIEYTSMNYEFWGTNAQNGVSVLKDIKFSNNIVRFAGLGFGGIQRKIKTDQGIILGWDFKYDEDDSITDFVISNNIFDTSDCYIFRTSDTLPIIYSGNKYYQGKSSFLVNRASSIKAVNQETLESAIATFDTNAAEIKWLD